MDELSELLSVNCAFGDTQALLDQKNSIFEMTSSNTSMSPHAFNGGWQISTLIQTALHISPI